MNTKSSVSTRARQSPKRKVFPPWHHPSGWWCKKVRGKFYYFGSASNDPNGQQALVRWLTVRDDLLSGRTPRIQTDGLTIRDLCNRFLTSKQHLVDTCEITERTFCDYYSACERLVNELGKSRLVDDLAVDDFEHLRKALAKTRGPVALGNEI